MKNSAYQGGCYPQRPKAEVDNTLRDLQNSSYPTKAESNNCFIIHSKYFSLLKGVSPLRSLIFRSPNITQPCPQVFSVNGSITCGGISCGGLYFWRHWFNMAKILTSLVQYLVNSSCLWWITRAALTNQKKEKYFEWVKITFVYHLCAMM